MNVTKYEQSCLVVEVDASRLVIDPGNYLSGLPELSDVVAIVLTHEHADHFSAEHVREILAQNPDARVLGPQGVADAAAAEGIAVEAVRNGDAVAVGPFALRFFGETHAVVHSSIPVVDNVGVLVNDALYYAGDSYTMPGVPVELLATPAGAPWLKLSDTIEYVLAVAPPRAFPVHEMPLSVIGKGQVYGRLAWAVEQGGGAFAVLEPGESLEL